MVLKEALLAALVAAPFPTAPNVCNPFYETICREPEGLAEMEKYMLAEGNFSFTYPHGLDNPTNEKEADEYTIFSQDSTGVTEAVRYIMENSLSREVRVENKDPFLVVDAPDSTVRKILGAVDSNGDWIIPPWEIGRYLEKK